MLQVCNTMRGNYVSGQRLGINSNVISLGSKNCTLIRSLRFLKLKRSNGRLRFAEFDQKIPVWPRGEAFLLGAF